MIRLFFGSPGSGKTTLAVKLLYRQKFPLFRRPRYRFLFSNINDSIAQPIDMSELDLKTVPPKSYIVCDESGIEFNNRSFKSFPKGCIEFFKKHRHEECDIEFFSQSYDDTDKIIRDLSVELWHVGSFGQLTVARRYFMRTGIDKDTKQPITEYYTRSALLQPVKFILNKLTFGRIGIPQFMFCFRPLYYRYFDSFDKLDRPYIEFDPGKEIKKRKNTHAKA